VSTPCLVDRLDVLAQDVAPGGAELALRAPVLEPFVLGGEQAGKRPLLRVIMKHKVHRYLNPSCWGGTGREKTVTQSNNEAQSAPVLEPFVLGGKQAGKRRLLRVIMKHKVHRYLNPSC